MCTYTCNLVIDAPLVIHFRINTLVTFSDQSGIEHAFERAVKSARPHCDLALRICLDLFHDAVAVTLSAGKCQENMKNSWRKRWSSVCGSHITNYIRDGYSCQGNN